MNTDTNDIEQSILGAILKDSTILEDLAEVGLHARHFTNPNHGRLYQFIRDLCAESEIMDQTLLPWHINAIKDPESVGGISYVLSLIDCWSTRTASAVYAKKLIEQGKRKQLSRIISDCMVSCGDATRDAEDIADEVRGKIDSLQTDGRGVFVSAGDCVADFLTQVEESRSQSKEPDLSTGLYDLDQISGRMKPAQLIIIAARPSMGKTALGLNIASSVAQSGGSVAFFSMEMLKKELGHRLLASMASVSASSLKTGTLTPQSAERVRDAQERLKSMDLNVLDASSLTMSEIAGKSRRLRRRTGKLDLIVIDYLQLVESETRNANREREVAEISRAAKKLSVDLECPIILISQLNRACEQRQDKRPLMSDLRESGAIEQDADQVWFVYRPEYYWPEDEDLARKAEIIVSKNRSGRTGSASCTWDADCQVFYESM